MQWNLLSPLEQRHWEHRHQDYACKRNCVPVPEQPLLISSAQSLLTWKLNSDYGQMSLLQADSPGFCLALCLQVGLSQGKGSASETVLAWPVYSWSQMTLQCISFPGTYAFLLLPWRPSLGRHEVTSHQVLTSVWVLNARSANALSCVEYAAYVYLMRIAGLQGWFSKGRQTFSI